MMNSADYNAINVEKVTTWMKKKYAILITNGWLSFLEGL